MRCREEAIAKNEKHEMRFRCGQTRETYEEINGGRAENDEFAIN